jgi:hypothetical protein
LQETADSKAAVSCKKFVVWRLPGIGGRFAFYGYALPSALPRPLESACSGY